MPVLQILFASRSVEEQWPLPNIPRAVTKELEVVVPLELPTTSIVQANLANQPTLLLSQDHHAVFILLMRNPREPSIPRSMHKTEKNQPNDSDADVARSALHIR